MTTEHERIARLRELFARLGPAPSPAVEVGIGDDCAVLARPRGPLVWTIDSAVEGIHFRRDRMSLEHIGYRAFMAAASDLAAMGAAPTGALSALTLSAAFSDSELDTLITGIARAASACACPVIGGNLTRGSELSLTTTLLGEPHGKALLRSGARAGDGLFVTGPLGGAALGLHALLAQRTEPEFAPFIAAFLSPRARLDIAARLANVASSAIDISDGLMQDAGHLCRASQLSAHIDLARVPRLPGYAEAARALALDVENALTTGGDDYEVLFAAPYDLDLTEWATRIGRMQPGPAEAQLLDAQGARLVTRAPGFDHFR